MKYVDTLFISHQAIASIASAACDGSPHAGVLLGHFDRIERAVLHDTSSGDPDGTLRAMKDSAKAAQPLVTIGFVFALPASIDAATVDIVTARFAGFSVGTIVIDASHLDGDNIRIRAWRVVAPNVLAPMACVVGRETRASTLNLRGDAMFCALFRRIIQWIALQRAAACLMQLMRFAAYLFCVAAITSCSDANANPAFLDSCRSIGICDEPAPPPVSIDIVCDPTASSTCTHETLPKSVDAALDHVADRPGSRIRVWVIGKDIASTAVTAEQVVPEPAHGGERAQKAQRAKFHAAAREHLVAATAHVFSAPAVKKSPVAESLTKVAMADAGGLPRHVVYVGDLREVSDTIGDFECKKLPSDASFAFLLRRSHLLAPGTFDGIAVELTFFDAPPVARGCQASISRDAQVRSLWSNALKAAGADDVRVSSGPPVFRSHAPTGGR